MTGTLTPARIAAPPPPPLAAGAARRLRDRLTPYGYIAPFFVIFAVFGLFPLLFTFYVALFDWNPIGDRTFIGVDNFTRMFADPRFWNAAGNTLSIWVLSAVPQLLSALLLAHVLNHARLRFALFFRMAVLVPYITSVTPPLAPPATTRRSASDRGSWPT